MKLSIAFAALFATLVVPASSIVIEPANGTGCWSSTFGIIGEEVVSLD
jgi:hypothetical protein